MSTMGKHFVTVCVFCLLCATHSPCSSHVQISSNENRIDAGITTMVNVTNQHHVKKPPFERMKSDNRTDWDLTSEINRASVYRNLKRSNKIELDSVDIRNNSNNLSVNNNGSVDLRREKRDSQRKMDEQVYLKKIFTLFGNGDSMNISGFEQFVRTLHLEKLLDSGVDSTVTNNNNNNNNGHNVSVSPLYLICNKRHVSDLRRFYIKISKCMDDKTLLRSINHENPVHESNNSDFSIDWTVLKRLCPVFLYQLVAPTSLERQGCIVSTTVTEAVQVGESRLHSHTVHHNHGTENIGAVWLYSTISIIIISACGLLGVLVIPIMQKHIYQHLIQFLVALAVGTLAGDALMHLLPHAMMGDHSHESHGMHEEVEEHSEVDIHALNMWRGFVAMVAMIFFFLMERFLTLGTEWRKQRQLRKNKVPPRVRVMREPENSATTSVGEKLCKHKYSSYPYCYDVIATETQDDHHNRQQHAHNSNHCDCLQNNTTVTIINDLDNSETEFLTKHPEANQNLSKCLNNTKNMKCSESNKMLSDTVDTNNEEYSKGDTKKLSESASYTVILREHENKHHGHSHAHGHVHSAPKTMSNVVWMVVMGDGLHNFTDGMAIGAAFAGSLAGGFSTAVAVFCHELPHEIGDFAVLLKAGMSAKQAVFYNMLSSLLCLFGMILGVTLGKNESASGWLFAAASGVFLYIALVDMVPELTSSHSKEGGSLTQCILQFMGMITGVAIMLVIALYENDLKQLFQD